MKPKASHLVQFINLSCPADAASAESQRRAHSHAARIAHARSKQYRILQLQAAQAIRDAERDQLATMQGHGYGTPKLSAPTSARTERLPAANPRTLGGAGRHDPFASLVRPLKPIEHRLVDCYVTAVIPHQLIHCNKVRNTKEYVEFRLELLQFCLANNVNLNGILLSACRYLSVQQHQEDYIRLALYYKFCSVRDLRKAIPVELASRISSSTITTALLLAQDEAQLGDKAGVRAHLQGLLKMVELNGGPDTLGFDGFLAHVISQFALWAGLLEGPPLVPLDEFISA